MMGHGDAYLQIFSMSRKTPLEALTSAYAERLRAIRNHATAAELAESRAWIAELETLALSAACSVSNGCGAAAGEPTGA